MIHHQTPELLLFKLKEMSIYLYGHPCCRQLNAHFAPAHFPTDMRQ